MSGRNLILECFLQTIIFLTISLRRQLFSVTIAFFGLFVLYVTNNFQKDNFLAEKFFFYHNCYSDLYTIKVTFKKVLRSR